MTPEALAYRAQFASPECKPCGSIKKRLLSLRNEFADRAAGYYGRDGFNSAWYDLPREHRLLVLLSAGIDGDLTALAGKRWDEFTPPERVLMSSAVRHVRKNFARATALCYANI